MAETTEPVDGSIDREIMELLMFGTGRVRRFTQDSPVLPDVWLEYAKSGTTGMPVLSESPYASGFPPVRLLFTPTRETPTGDVRKALRDRLEREHKSDVWKSYARVVYHQTTVAATLYFEELIRVVLPMTEWWKRRVEQWSLDDFNHEVVASALFDPENAGEAKRSDGTSEPLAADLLWLIRVVGALAYVRGHGALPAPFDRRDTVAKATPEDWQKLWEAIVGAVADILRNIVPFKGDATIWSVSLNREATPTVAKSTLAIKADAGRRLFEISCADLRWGIIDSGIDARHPAFRKRQHKDGKDVLIDKKFLFADENGKPANNTRVVATYDFTYLDVLLDPDNPKRPARVTARLEKASAEERKRLEENLDELQRALTKGRTIDWGLVEPLLRIPHDVHYVDPPHDHGTHVAGILAGDWTKDDNDRLPENIVGVCPDLQLYDLRVLDDKGRGDEFSVMAALQFVRHLNSTNDYMAVHGVNLSLSIPHDIANYACGRTPVCDECERVVAAGVVVVAAAGNQGYRKYRTAEGVTTEAYNSISVTDPGNADLVITVGATHRFRPHTYGVSYFSSRGPTGDGRLKPDLVAPGEKINAPLPKEKYGVKDGTSMAAPHVSGAAALLIARYNELLGRPQRIKQILCSTATDLGRERYFQGAGMLDVLRALQSV